MRRIIMLLVATTLLILVSHGEAQEISSPVFAAEGEADVEDSGGEVPVVTNWAIARKRPGPLPGLYASLGALQGADLWLTRRAVDRGAREANPLMRVGARNAAVGIAIKAASTASTIFVVERLWKDNHRTAAVVTMIAINSAMTAVVAHNARQPGGR